MTRRAVRFVSFAAALALLAGCGGNAASAIPAIESAIAASSAAAPSASTPSAAEGFNQAAAEQYCTDQGGQLVPRRAAYNTNADQSQWLMLAGSQTFCEFEMTEDGNTTRISVDLVTLYSEEPTLASVAYLSKVPPTLPKDSSSPATYNCLMGLGGSGAFGNGAGGGGWVDPSQATFIVMDMCTFEDMSAIDAWGILYYADGTVRGADLATKFRYQPDGDLPPIFN